jgi:hypothetical protein
MPYIGWVRRVIGNIDKDAAQINKKGDIQRGYWLFRGSKYRFI